MNIKKKTGFRKQTEDAGTSHQTVSAVPIQTKHEAFLLSATHKTGGQRTQGALNEPSEALSTRGLFMCKEPGETFVWG